MRTFCLKFPTIQYNMKVILINPSQSVSYGGIGTPKYLPLGLAYIGAVLEQNGHNVRMIDMDSDGLTKEGLGEELRLEKPDLAGITVLTSSYNEAVLLSDIIKKSCSAYTVFGGIHPTVLPEESIEPESVDFVIKGEGERSMLELIRCIERKEEFAQVDGLIFKNNGKIIVNKNRDLIENLDYLPFPARHLFRNQEYSFPDTLTQRAFPIITSRGCPGNCTYCNTKNIFTRRLRFRSPESVIREIEFLIENYGAKEIHIWDDNFITHTKRVFQIRDEIKNRRLKLKFSFPNGLRADYISGEIIEALVEMGTYSIAFGVESGNQDILDRVKKGLTIEDIKRAFSLAKKAGLETWAFFILGLPGENKDTLLETINFAKQLNPDVAKFHLLQPFPGTEIFQEFFNKGLIRENNYDKYGIHSAPLHLFSDLNREELIYGQRMAYRQFYLRPIKLLSQLVRIKSWNRLRMNLQSGLWLLKKMFDKF